METGIVPYITLFHWDYPYELYKKGGWLNSESSEWFAEYTGVVIRRLSDRVKHWITFNEPQCFIGLGHHRGTHAPGLKLSFDDLMAASHNFLLSHGKAVQTIRAFQKQPCQVGYAPTGTICYPDQENSANIEAARNATFSVKELNFENHAWWSDPIYLGKYPEDGLKLFEQFLPEIGQNDLQIINQPLDFVGLNIYHGRPVEAGVDGDAVDVPKYEGFPQTHIHWPVTPEALYWGPKFMYERYKKPILITENGLSCADVVSLDGKVHDSNRIDYLHRYLKQYKRAADDGVDLAGYFTWSVMDNFEWAEGYHHRFGLIYVDYLTQKRIIKDSGYWYKSVINSNGECL